ncbi:unnamed protein product [Trichobilharzia regenti]|nr:unnamed protein product [Trichobilharzia regenti]
MWLSKINVNEASKSCLENKEYLVVQPRQNSALLAPSIVAVVNNVTEFHNNPDANMIFDAWFKRYEDRSLQSGIFHPR